MPKFRKKPVVIEAVRVLPQSGHACLRISRLWLRDRDP